MANDSQSGRLEPNVQSGPPVRPRRTRRAAFVGALLIAVSIGAGLVYNHYTDPQRIRAIAEAHLQQYTEGVVEVKSARFSLFSGVRLFDVSVWSRKPQPGSDPGGSVLFGGAQRPSQDTTWPRKRGPRHPPPVFFCREVRLAVSHLSSILGGLEIHTVVAVEPTCTIVRNATDGRTNLMGLLQFPTTANQTVPKHLPILELRDARIHVVSREGDEDRVIEDLKLTIRARPSPTDAHVYDVVWHGGNSHVADGHSQIDLQTGRLRNVRGGLPWMSIEAVLVALNARYDGAGAWCDLLGLDGTVRATDYDFGGGAGDGEARWATIELSDATISIPINDTERPLAPEQRYLRFTQVDGRVRLTPEGISAEFTGRFHGGDCKVSATIRGGVEQLMTLDDVDFDARLSIRGLELPQPDPHGTPPEARFIKRWRKLANLYRDYDPHGLADLEIDVTKRAGADEPVVVHRAVLTARGGDASCRYYPYRVRGLEGSVEYTRDGVYIRNLRGRHEDGIVSVEGRLASPTRWSAKKLTILGQGITVDHALYSALPDRFRRIRDLFDPKGAVDLEIHLSQPAGTEAAPGKWRSRSTVTLRDVSARYVGFPYPVDQLTGTLVVEGDTLDVVHVSGRSGRARIGVEGTATFSAGGPGSIDLAIHAQDVPLDDTLMAALPAETRSSLGVFHPRGRFDIETTLSREPDTGRIVHRSHVTLQDVAIRHERLPVEVTGITGRLDVTPGRIVALDLTGRYQSAVVSADGFVDRTSPTSTTEFNIRTDNLQLDGPLRAALPQALRDVLAGWRIDGPIATESVVRIASRGAAEDTVVRTVARLKGVTISHPSVPVPLRDVRGEITIDEEGARAANVEARFGQASVRVSFDTRRNGQGDEGTIELSATGLVLDESLRGLLPERLAAAWDRLKPTGTIDLYLDSIRFRRAGAEHRRVWSADGYVECSDVSLSGTPDVRRMSGTLVGSGSLVDHLGGTRLAGRLALASADVYGQQIGHLESNWSYVCVAQGEGVLKVDALTGRIHGGFLAGGVEVAFTPQRTDYKLSLTVHGMQIEPLVNADGASRRANGDPAAVSGLADGRLHLSGVVGDTSSRRGGGRFEIRDGHIYRLPIILAILHVLNLSIPDTDAFEDVKAEFFVVGGRVKFTDILLRGSGLALVGSGSMTLPDRALDLFLVNVNPRRWGRVPVLSELVEGASRELVELHVTGPLAQPKVRIRPFRALTDELKRLFQKKKPRATGASTS